MPCQLIYLTDKPVRETGPKKQDLRLSVEVGAIDEVTLVATCYEGTDVTLRLHTGLQTESEAGWVALTPDFALLAANGADKKVYSGLLRFMRWELVSASTATFMIAGIARSSC